ncbi:12680_t:CDS:10 [Acaulospora colombiana]|uniref:12680_t:CDS:1 n=1 Tax=Acaulospora colombiana TaxID=27376 RepID=A0ACA9KHG9_9GLOM|nr:12680_t:CDS:10 [Acaulospora colombiana]
MLTITELTSNPVPGFTVALQDDSNVFEWDVGIIGAPNTIYEGGYFKATLKFPNDYPFNPPTFKFNNEFFHPNVYMDGRLCISILHPPGDDPTSGETAEVMYRKDRDSYNKIVRSQVEASKKDIPEGLKIPTSTDDFVVQKRPSDDEQDENFCNSVNCEPTLSIVDKSIVLPDALDGDDIFDATVAKESSVTENRKKFKGDKSHTHESSGALHQNVCDFLSGEGIFETISQEDNERKTLADSLIKLGIVQVMGKKFLGINRLLTTFKRYMDRWQRKSDET